RRHTRSKRDWSSDVCSSDLITMFIISRMSWWVSWLYIFLVRRLSSCWPIHFSTLPSKAFFTLLYNSALATAIGKGLSRFVLSSQIGRASCRESGYDLAGGGR